MTKAKTGWAGTWHRNLIVDDIYWLIGFGALLAYMVDGHRFPDPLSVAILAILILQGRAIDRAALKSAGVEA